MDSKSARRFLLRRAGMAALFSMVAASTWACGSEDNASFGGTCHENRRVRAVCCRYCFDLNAEAQRAAEAQRV